MLPLQVRVDLGVMAIKGYFAFPKAPAFLEPHHQMQLMSYPYVTGCCNWSFFALFNVVFILMHLRYLPCWRVLFLLFSWYIYCHHSDVKSCTASSTFLSSGSLVWGLFLSILRMVPNIFQRGSPRFLFFWWHFLGRSCFLEVFSFV